MTSVDKAAIAWTIAIVAVGAGFAAAGMGGGIDFGIEAPTMTTPTMVEEREKAIAEQMEEALEEKVSVPAPKVMEPPKMMGPKTFEVSVPEGTAVPGCEETNACYIPASVSVSVGSTVVWNNDDTAAHTVTSGSAQDGPDGIFDSSLFMAGDSFEVTFDNKGSFDYFCMVHPWMTGNVKVS